MWQKKEDFGYVHANMCCGYAIFPELWPLLVHLKTIKLFCFSYLMSRRMHLKVRGGNNEIIVQDKMRFHNDSPFKIYINIIKIICVLLQKV